MEIKFASSEVTRSRVCHDFVLRTSFPNSLSHVHAFHPPSVVSFRKTKKTILDIFSSSFSSSSRVYAQCKQERRRRDAGRPCVGLTLSLVVAWRGEGEAKLCSLSRRRRTEEGIANFFFFCYLIWCRRQRRELRKAAGQTRPTDRQRTRGRMKGVRSSKTGTARPPPKAGFFFSSPGERLQTRLLAAQKEKGQSAPHVLLIRPDSGGGPFTMQVSPY